MRKVIPASADGNIEFSGKIGPLWVSTSVCDGIQTDEIVDSVAKFTGVDQFMFIDSGERITDHVSHTVEGGLEGCLISGMEAINDIRSVLNLDTTKLNVLSSCNVDDTTFTVLFDALGVKSHLLRVNDAIGCLEAHHELTGRSLVSVKHADVFNTLRIERRESTDEMICDEKRRSMRTLFGLLMEFTPLIPLHPVSTRILL